MRKAIKTTMIEMIVKPSGRAVQRAIIIPSSIITIYSKFELSCWLCGSWENTTDKLLSAWRRHHVSYMVGSEETKKSHNKQEKHSAVFDESANRSTTKSPSGAKERKKFECKHIHFEIFFCVVNSRCYVRL